MAGIGEGQYYQQQAGLNSVGSYQISGIPYVTSSTAPASGTVKQVHFNSVSKFIVVKNAETGSTSKIRVGFSENGVKGSNYYLLGPSESFSADIRVTDIYLMSHDTNAYTASVIAGLTGVSSNNLPQNWSGSLGVG
jgi:hypothetical protein